MTYTLMPSQHETLTFITPRPRAMVLSEQGVGKTLVLLVHLSNLLLGGEITNALVVSTASGVAAWERDTDKLSADRQRLIREAVTLINYDKLSRKDGQWQEKVWRNWDLIVLDESQCIKKPTSNRTKYFVGHGKRLGLTSMCKYLYLLTGTLITNSHLEDAWAPLRAVYQEDWPIEGYEDMTWARFKSRYLVTKNLPGSYAEIVVGYRNRAELLELIARVSYRVLAADVLVDKPTALPDEVITVPWAEGINAEPFGKTTQELYEDALDSYVEALDKVADNPLTRLMLMRQIAAGHVKDSDIVTEAGRRVKGETYRLRSGKIAEAVRLVRENLPNKTVLAYQFSETCAALEDALDEAGIAYHTLNGAQNDKRVWQKFQTDDVPVFIGQYQSSARAIDLFAASVTVFVEPTDSSEIMEQYRKRTDRHGQTEACRYVFLLTENSVEVDMYKRLEQHLDFSETAYREMARARAAMRS